MAGWATIPNGLGYEQGTARGERSPGAAEHTKGFFIDKIDTEMQWELSAQ